MDLLTLDDKLSNLILKAIETPSEFVDCAQPYKIQSADVTFAKKEVNGHTKDLESRVDALSKLFIAFYLDSIPGQIVANLKSAPVLYKKNERSREYLVMIAGLLFESKTLLLEYPEQMMPYLLGYREFVADSPANNVPEEDLNLFFVSVIENAIQTVINY